MVAVLRLSGAIGAVSMARRGLTLAALEPIIKRAFARRARAVCLVINSPGGSAVQSSQIAGLIRQYSQEKKIPVFAFVEDVAASGGYWLSLAADQIYADPMSVVGSIGVISASFGFHDLIERIGIERRVHAQGTHKSMLDPFKPEDEEDVRRLGEIQADIHKEFKSFVRARRGSRLRADDDVLFNGDVWTGNRALDLGLIDGLGDVRSVMRDKYGPNVRFQVLDRGPGFLQRLFGRLVPGQALGSFGGDSGGWVSDALAAVEERALWARFGL